jgi:tripartite-type tricarboxylate transporter receptor subunit TctC
VVVQNKPGAGSSIAAEYVARSVNDGYTLFVPTLSMLTDEIVNPDRSIHLDKDFSPIALLGSIAIVLIVAPNANVHSVSELVALAKSKPGQVSYGSVGAGTLLHLAGMLFAQRADIQLLHVPYQGRRSRMSWPAASRCSLLRLHP